MTVPAGVIVMWPSTAGTIPSGWSRVTALDDVYLKGVPDNATDPGGSGGNAQHSHGGSGHTHSLSHSHTQQTNTGTSNDPNEESDINNGSVFRAEAAHRHSLSSTGSAGVSSGSASPGSGAANNELIHLKVIFIQSDGTPVNIPAGALALWPNPTLPGSWTLYANGQGRFLKGAVAAGDGGGTDAGNSTHSHSISSHTHGGAVHGSQHNITTGAGDKSVRTGFTSGGVNSVVNPEHTHSVSYSEVDTGTTGSAGATSGATAAPEPSWVKLGIIESPNDAPPESVIALWMGTLASIPAGWILCEGVQGAPNLLGKFVKGVSSLGEVLSTGGGTPTHTHSGGSHTHSIGSHSHTGTVSHVGATGTNGQFDPDQSASPDHDHPSFTVNSTNPSVGSGSAGLTSADAEPVFKQVAFIMLVPVPTSDVKRTFIVN